MLPYLGPLQLDDFNDGEIVGIPEHLGLRHAIRESIVEPQRERGTYKPMSERPPAARVFHTPGLMTG